MRIPTLAFLCRVAAAAALVSSAPAQTPQIASIVSAANFQPAAAPGSLISIFGTGLATGTNSASSTPLPYQLENTSVSINGVAVPLVYVSPAQINAQVPYETPGNSSAIVQVLANGIASPTVSLSVSTAAPAIFTQSSNGNGLAAILHADYSFVTESAPAQPGETVILYATGLGATSPGVPTGGAGSGQPFAQTPVIGVGGLKATVPFAGAAPGFAGLAQLNFTVPYLNPGDQPIVVYSNGAQSSSSVTIPVSAASEQLQTIPTSYFGMHLGYQYFLNELPWPVLQFGAIRLLGDRVTWADLEPSPGRLRLQCAGPADCRGTAT